MSCCSFEEIRQVAERALEQQVLLQPGFGAGELPFPVLDKTDKC